MSDVVTIFEVGPRDGLQNEQRLIPTEDKIKLINLLSKSGLSKIEATSFVSQKWVPQMGDAAQVMAGIERRRGINFVALTPNKQGLDAAIDARVDEVAIFASASESFSKKNINCSIAESFERFEHLMPIAKAAGLPVRGYISCVIACPYDGLTDPVLVAAITQRLQEIGCYEISLGDTIGAGQPASVSTLIKAVQDQVPRARIAGHFHDTDDRALANVRAALDLGVRVFDSSIAGLGGCPYAPGAKGNVDTQAVVALVEAEGFETGLNAGRLQDAANFARTLKDGSS